LRGAVGGDGVPVADGVVVLTFPPVCCQRLI
jgi:hypothetical protein